MTHDNHPTAAPLTAEQIQSIRVSHEKCGDDCNILNMADMALASLARPAPSDMAEYVNRCRAAIECAESGEVPIISMIDTRWDKTVHAGVTERFDRIVAHLSPRDAAPSGDAKSFANKFYASDDENDVESFSRSSFEKIIHQALDQARAEGRTSGLEEAATIMDLAYSDAHYRESFTKKELVLSGVRLAKQIRALIPAGQQTKEDGK